MQTLDYQDQLARAVHKDFPVPEGRAGIPIDVSDGKEQVIMTINGVEIAMTTDGARNLALALRQSANRIEREIRARK